MLYRQAQTSIHTLLLATTPTTHTSHQQQLPNRHQQPQPLDPLAEPPAAPTKGTKTKTGRLQSTSSSSPVASQGQGQGMSLSLLSVLHMVRTHCTTSTGTSGSTSIISPKAAAAAATAAAASTAGNTMLYDGVAALSAYFLWLQPGDSPVHSYIPPLTRASCGWSQVTPLNTHIYPLSYVLPVAAAR